MRFAPLALFKGVIFIATEPLRARLRGLRHELAVREGLIQLPEIDPYDKLAEYMAKALREEYATDERVLATDVEVYNDMNRDKTPIPMLFDFRDDGAKRRGLDDAA